MAQSIKSESHPALSGWPMMLGWLAMIIFACHASTHMVGAGDTWVAMACGRHFVNHGVDTVEPFSANSHRPGPTQKDIENWPPAAKWVADKVGLDVVKYWHPTGWVNQNWLTHVIFYLLIPESSYTPSDNFSSNALVYWKFTIYILTIICVYYTGKVLGVNPALSAVFACFAMFAGRSYFDVRPAGFSNLLTAVFLLILVLATYRNILYIWLIVPLGVFWCNLHGGYIYLFIILVPFTGLNLLTCIFRKRFVSIGLKGIYHTIGAGLATFLAVVLFNPFHLTSFTHTFIISVSEHAEMWRQVDEWHPAFEWNNRVGTSHPFLVVFVLGSGLLILWLFSRLLKPKFLRAPKSEFEAQKKLFKILSIIIGYAASVFICWVVLISFALLSLDAAGFFICALFVGILLLSIYKNVQLVFLLIPLTLVALWTTDAKAGYMGRYIYPFITVPAYVITHSIVSQLSPNVKIKLKNIILVILSAVAALVLMIIIIDPFKFAKPLWNLSQLWNLQRIWYPHYELSGRIKLNYRYMFAVLHIVNAASVIIWLAIAYLKKIFGKLPNKTSQQLQANTYQLPKINPALIAIAALTVYMAIRSRRFIPVAAIAICPVIAMFIDHIIRTVSAARNFHRHNRLTVSPMPYPLRMFFIILATAAVAGFGTWWGLKFKGVYLDPWHTDTKFNSVFMRMTASNVKPFYACKFIKDNKLEGNMFNYWTEGGFIAWGQSPDPNTGRTPLQLFMDGRAQAAYEPKDYEAWSEIMFAGPTVLSAKLRKRKLTTDDYEKIGIWISKELRKRKVWLVLMPIGEFDKDFVKGLERNPDWPAVFFNNKQKIFVDKTTAVGLKLLNGIFDGTTVYPNAFCENLIKAHCMRIFGRGKVAKKRALDYAIKAFKLNPSHAPMLEILSAVRFTELKPYVDGFCKDYIDDFIKNKDVWVKEDGHHNRVAAAINAAGYLQSVARKQKDTKLAEFYKSEMKKYSQERKLLVNAKRW